MLSEPHTSMMEQMKDLSLRVPRLAMAAGETSEVSGTPVAVEVVD